MKRIKFLKAIVLSMLVVSSLSMLAQSKLDKQVLMTIGNQKVTVKEFTDVYAKNNLKSDVIEKKSVDEYLDLYINFRMKVMEAYAMGLIPMQISKKSWMAIASSWPSHISQTTKSAKSSSKRPISAN
jgi:hypothetical protein